MQLDDVRRVPHIRLRPGAQGFALGAVFALGIFIATNWLILKGGANIGAHIQLLAQYFIGYDVSFLGSLIGAAYGFVTGYSLGYINAAVYNWYLDRKNPDPLNSIST